SAARSEEGAPSAAGTARSTRSTGATRSPRSPRSSGAARAPRSVGATEAAAPHRKLLRSRGGRFAPAPFAGIGVLRSARLLSRPLLPRYRGTLAGGPAED